jgi:tRNA A37 N6-isopentenylltransferase MiaA
LTATRINEAPRQYWSSFQPIANLGCRITDGEKLKALEQVFYLTPQPLPENIQDKSLLQSFGVKQLRELAKKRNIKRFSKMSKAELVESIASD